MVGDPGASGIGGYGEGVNLPPAPGSPGSNLQLLSDPMGVDFRPYLTRVLASVRMHWLAILPESVRMGRRGQVAIQFAISRDGGVPKLVIANSSGTDALDRAAVAGISASVPFPPLPTEFKGSTIRLQFNFAYNMPRR
jgi:TonB family protein